MVPVIVIALIVIGLLFDSNLPGIEGIAVHPAGLRRSAASVVCSDGYVQTSRNCEGS